MTKAYCFSYSVLAKFEFFLTGLSLELDILFEIPNEIFEENKYTHTHEIHCTKYTNHSNTEQMRENLHNTKLLEHTWFFFLFFSVRSVPKHTENIRSSNQPDSNRIKSTDEKSKSNLWRNNKQIKSYEMNLKWQIKTKISTKKKMEIRSRERKIDGD